MQVLSPIQEARCDVYSFPFCPQVLALANILSGGASTAQPHVPLPDVRGLAHGCGFTNWPENTPFEALSLPATTRCYILTLQRVSPVLSPKFEEKDFLYRCVGIDMCWAFPFRSPKFQEKDFLYKCVGIGMCRAFPFLSPKFQEKDFLYRCVGINSVGLSPSSRQSSKRRIFCIDVWALICVGLSGHLWAYILSNQYPSLCHTCLSG
jgi:hypothetical protein